MDVSKIIEGWRNKLIPSSELKDTIEFVAAERKKICDSCEWSSINRKVTFRLDEHCTNCGCTLSAKTRCLSCECPLKKWTAYINTEENNTIKTELENG